MSAKRQHRNNDPVVSLFPLAQPKLIRRVGIRCHAQIATQVVDRVADATSSQGEMSGR